MTHRKKLIEVALPLEEISDAAASEKNIHTGLPANMHTWWSRKPLAASRAVLFATLIDDPSSDPLLSPEEVERERHRLHGIIGRLAHPDSISDERILQVARAEIARATGGKPPVFFDPFAGGGSIPLEALRLGLMTYATDLNPVAVILNKAMLEVAARYSDTPPVNPKAQTKLTNTIQYTRAQGLAEDIAYYSEWVSREAKRNIGHLFPKTPEGKDVVSWIWTRTVKCNNPACGARIPLVKKFWLSTHSGNEAWAKPVVDLLGKTVQFTISRDKTEPPAGTITNTGARCLICNSAIPFSYIRDEGKSDRMGYQLMSLVTDSPSGREYLIPLDEHVNIAESATPPWQPSSELPEKALGFRVQAYGITKHRDLFTNRQLTAIATFASLVNNAREEILSDTQGDVEYADAIATFLALAVDRLAQTNNTLVRWLVRKSGTSKGTPAFDRQVVSMVWEFSEGNVFGKSVGSWKAAVNNTMSAFQALPDSFVSAYSLQHDATAYPSFLPSPPLVSTDPPYFDNIGYADLSDFYYIWLRKTLGKVYPDILGTLLTPKQQELIAAPHLFQGDSEASEKHFLQGLRRAFQIIGAIANPEYPVTIYYAFKQSERFAISEFEEAYSSTGWETMLEALVDSGFQITGTWPIRTEQKARLRAVGSNALASSVVFCCRLRTENAPLTSRRSFIDTLRQELPTALREMQSGNIAPVDLAQASIGPGMAVYSKYRQVLEANGEALTVRAALQLINQVLDEFLAEQEGELDGDSRFAVAWFEQYGYKEGVFGAADVLARAKNTSVDGLVQAGIVRAGAGKVQLLSWPEMDPGWDPQADKRATVWEATHHLIERLNVYGEEGAALLLARMPAELAANARDLAYRLYSICERKGWAEFAREYNALVISWGASRERAAQVRAQATQARLFE